MATRSRRSLEERFWEKVDVRGPDDCWEFMGCRDADGYGRIGLGGRHGGTEHAYRIAYRLTKGPIPDGYDVRHFICNHPPCCNPKHLILGTRADNVSDMVTAGRWKNAPAVPLDPNRERWERPPDLVEVACAYCGLISLVGRWAAEQGRHRYCSREHYKADWQARMLVRFWSKVDRRGPDECWEWQAGREDSGYGVFDGRHAHRVAWEITNGAIPAGLIVRHYVCDNRPCCNVAHMKLGTRRQNSEDMVRKGRQATGDRSPRRLHPESYAVGEAHGNSKLTPDQVREMRRLYAVGGETHQSLGRRFGISAAIAGRIVSRKMWKHIE
jgi:hypothetical protein